MKQYQEDANSIIFSCSGAIDFIEQVNIELSLTEKEGFTKIEPLSLEIKICEIKHIRQILLSYFVKIVDKIPHISDRNENILVGHRFTEIYYRCYKKFHHSHEPYGNYTYTYMSLDDAIKYIKKRKLDIDIPQLKVSDVRDMKIDKIID